jgi:ABC-2 type transport system permease protein
MAEIFRLTLRQLLGRWRVLLIVFLASLPTLIVLLVKWQDPENAVYNQEFVQGMIDAMIVGGIMPIVTMTVAAAAFGNELEDRTLYYLVLKPLSRVHIVLAKLVATFVLAAPVVVASGVVATALVGADAGAVFTVGIALLAGVAAYASIFTWAGLITPRALSYGLVYVLVWEGILSSFLTGVRYLSVRGYTLSLLHGIDAKNFEILEERVIAFPAAIVGAVGVALVFFFLAQHRLRTMDVP